jgi:ankyrin repeat protein
MDQQLLEAVSRAKLYLVPELLKKGANPNVKDKLGWSPLHHAVSFNHLPTVKLLLEYGADSNLANNKKWTPLKYICH